VVLALAGYLVFRALRDEGPPGLLEVAVGSPESRGGSWVVPVRVVNRGDRAVRDVAVGVRRGASGDGPEEELSIDFVGEGSEEETLLFFDGAAPPAGVRARVLRYRAD